jgi:acyl-CoA synthetase (AMP-forming)/AMP-acid ligase II
MKISELLEAQANKYQDKPAIIFKGKNTSFRQLRDLSFRLARSLSNLRIKKGDKVAIYLPNCPEYIYSYLAVWCCGAVAVPLDFLLTEDELVSCISHSDTKLLIAKSKTNIVLDRLKGKCPELKEIILSDEKIKGFLNFEELLKKDTNKPPKVEIQDKDYAIIFYTSGTTGKPKGVLVNYLQLEASPKAMKYFVELGDKDIALCALPVSHLGGLVYLQGIVFLGTQVVLMERFVPLEFLKNIQNYKVSCLWLVPSMYYAILQLKEFQEFDLSSLNWIVSFGAPSSAEQLRRFHQYCPQAHLIHGWGMTETNAPTVVIPKGSSKIESIGRPAPWIEVKVFDENDKELPQGKIGEIVVRSWVITEGYYKDPEATAQAMRNGWFHTGDLGRFDADGDLYIVGRKKEMIKVSGEVVFEPEVEMAIHRHPEVAEVAVIGVPDKLRGEVPKAFVVLKKESKLTEDDLRYFLRQHLAHFKIPHYFEFKDSLPKNRVGKIDKEQLRKLINQTI